jgi:NADH dehydrogenase
VTVNSKVHTLDGVVVIGAGYAGLAAARAVRRAGVTITIIDDRSCHDFTTRIAGVAGGTLPPGDASTDIEFAADRVIQARFDGIQGSVLELSDGSEVRGEATVITVGSRPTHPPIKGIDHALTLRTADDALVLRHSVEHTDRRHVIVGGGASGVQLAGAISAAHPGSDVTLIEMAGRLLPEMHRRASDGAARILEDRGVDIITGSSVSEISADGVYVESGDRPDRMLIHGVAVWAAGFEARAEALGATLTDDGRVVMSADISVVGMERMFAAGDVAAHIDTNGDPLPMSAQIAEQAGVAAGRNAARVVLAQPTENAKLQQRGWVLDLGGGRGIAQFSPVTLASPVLDRIPPLVHRLIDLKHCITIAGRAGLLLRQR